MIGYELKHDIVTVTKGNEKAIKEGVTAMKEWADPERIKFSTDKNELLEELKKYKSYVRDEGKTYEVEEWWVEENTYDENGEFVEGTDFWKFSEMGFTIYDEDFKPVYASKDFDTIIKLIKQVEYEGYHYYWDNGLTEYTQNNIISNLLEEM